MSFIRYKKFGNKEYAYEVKTYWDPEAKRPRQKTRYLGVVVDKEKKVFERPRQRPQEKLILDFGDGYLVQELLKQKGIGGLLREVFSKRADEVMVLLCYRLCQGGAMRHLPLWFEGNISRIFFQDVKLTSQRISRLLKQIGRETIQRDFFKKYVSKYFKDSEGIIIDSTALPNEIDMGLSSWGYGDSSIEMQIRLVCVVDRGSGIPVYYRYTGRNIVDVSVFSTTIEELRKIGVGSSFVLVDAGFFSEGNIRQMHREGIEYLIRLPASRRVYKELIRRYSHEVEKPKNAIRFGKKVLFIRQEEVDLYGRKVYVHIVLDPERKGREVRRLMLEAIEEGRLKEKCLKYELSRRGIMLFLSSFEIERGDVVSLYYMRAKIEQLFGFSKDDLNLIPLRVHREEIFKGYLFLMFLTLVVFMMLRKELQNRYTVEEALMSMRNLKCKVFDKEILIEEVSKQQKEILSLLNIIVPKKVGI
jgi:transposase